MVRRQKGSVGIEVVRGRLRLRLPRQLYTNGKQYYISLELPDGPDHRRSAEMKARQIELDIISGQFDPTLSKYRFYRYEAPEVSKSPLAGQTLVQVEELSLIELWQRFTVFKRPSLSQSSLATDYEKTRNLIASLPTKSLNDAVKIRDFIISKYSSNATKRYLTKLSACCEWAVRSELIPSNPFKGMPQEIKLRRADYKRIDFFTVEERDQIISAFRENRDYCWYTTFVEFLFLTGCRPSEAIALEWSNISKDFKIITFEQAATESLEGLSVKAGLKTQSKRKFPINTQVLNLLHRVRDVKTEVELQGYVFPSPQGNLIDFHNFSNRGWRKVLKSLSIPYKKPYAMRHTFITLCLEAGIDAKDVASWVGNSSGTIYNHYAGINNDLAVPEL